LQCEVHLRQNIILAILQVYAGASSGSLSLLTTMADALFDPLLNLTLILSNRAVKTVDPRKFPSGKARIETVGNIVFCFVMNAVSWILIVVSYLGNCPARPKEAHKQILHNVHHRRRRCVLH
jgi:divalent metal cation (Fe/Co/Zn/Cd) transporter